LEKAIKAKGRDLEEILLLSKNAEVARSAAEDDYRDYEKKANKLSENRLQEIKAHQSKVDKQMQGLVEDSQSSHHVETSEHPVNSAQSF
jgi:hypothetical protein